MANTINQINAFKKELDDLQPLTLEQRELLDRKIRLEFNYNSNHIEGNTLTYGETKLLLFFDKAQGAHTLREYEEMKASDVALELVEELAKDKERPLTEAFIKNLNKIILVRPYWKEAETAEGQKTQREILVGDYKKYPNSVRLQNGEIFHYAAPSDVPMLMEELISWFQKELSLKEKHPLELAALLHYKFVRIHPFDDGNGRISRLLMNYVLLFHDFPPVIIKSAEKKEYLSALQSADAGNIDYFIDYIGEQLLWSINLYIKAAKNENIEEEQDWKKELHLLKSEINNKEEIKIVKSDKVTIGLINGTIKNFAGEIMKELHEASELFLTTFILYTSNKAKAYTPFETEVTTLKIGDFSTEINYMFFFDDFKKNGLNPFNVRLTVNFVFDNYGYSVAFENDESTTITKLYHEVFSKEDIGNYVNRFGKLITETIKEKIKN